MDREKIAFLLLRLGVAFSFIYAAFSAYLNPTNWIGYIPDFLTFGLDKLVFLNIHSVVDLILGLWLLSGKKIVYPTVLSALFLAAIIVFNLGSLDILYRDITILFATVALALLSCESKKK